MRSRPVILFTALSVLTVGLFLLDLAVGAVRIPVGDVWAALTGGDCPRTTAKIVLNIRLIKAVVALLAGAALSVSGLQMQTLFRNPLAGPYVLGISSGASLGVALVVLAGVIRIMELKSATPDSPAQLCQLTTSGILATSAAVSRTARSSASTGVPTGSSMVTLKVFLLSLGRNPISTPHAGVGLFNPPGMRHCPKGMMKTAIQRKAVAHTKTISRLG